jgi:hypothetical protein
MGGPKDRRPVPAGGKGIPDPAHTPAKPGFLMIVSLGPCGPGLLGA